MTPTIDALDLLTACSTLCCLLSKQAALVYVYMAALTQNNSNKVF